MSSGGNKLAKGKFRKSVLDSARKLFKAKNSLLASLFNRNGKRLVERGPGHDQPAAAVKNEKALLEKIDGMEKSPELAKLLAGNGKRPQAQLEKDLARLYQEEVRLLINILKEMDSELVETEKQLEKSTRELERALRGIKLDKIQGRNKQAQEKTDLLAKLLLENLKDKPHGNA